MFCDFSQPVGRISLTLNCGMDCASVRDDEVEPIEGGVRMRLPWAFEPGSLIAVGRECKGCERCLEPVEMLVAECAALGADQPGYSVTLLFMEKLGERCGLAAHAAAPFGPDRPDL